MRSRTARVMTTLMRNGRDRRSENPSGPTRYLSACEVSGTDQRITSGPAATAAASPWRQASKRKQAVYMAAPERFAKRQIPSCTAGTVHTWPISAAPTSRLRARYQVSSCRAGPMAGAAVDDPTRKSSMHRTIQTMIVFSLSSAPLASFSRWRGRSTAGPSHCRTRPIF